MALEVSFIVLVVVSIALGVVAVADVRSGSLETCGSSVTAQCLEWLYHCCSPCKKVKGMSLLWNPVPPVEKTFLILEKLKLFNHSCTSTYVLQTLHHTVLLNILGGEPHIRGVHCIDHGDLDAFY